MYDIFGGKNFVAALPTIMNLKGNQDEFGFAGTHEYTLVYCLSYDYCEIGQLPLEDEELDERCIAQADDDEEEYDEDMEWVI